MNIEEFDNAPGKFHGGLRTMEESSMAFSKATYGERFIREVTMKNDMGPAFPAEQTSANRKADRPCHVRHPGLCRTAHAAVHAEAVRFAKHLFDLVAGMEQRAGECVIEIRLSGSGQQEPHFFWLMRRFGLPQRMHFAETSACTVGDDHFIDINRPVVSITNFGIAVKLLTQRGARAVFTVRSVVHRSSKRPLWRTGDIGRGEPLTLSGVVRAKARAEVDPLERALAVASGAVAKRRRVKGKQADESESAEDSEGSVSSEIVVHEQRRLAVKQSSFFYTEVGLKSVETVHPGLGKCRVCEAKIKKAEARCIWVQNVRRPHGYVHATCTHRMSETDARVAMDLLNQVQVEGPNADAVRASVAGALDLLAKRFPTALPFCAIYIYIYIYIYMCLYIYVYIYRS